MSTTRRSGLGGVALASRRGRFPRVRDHPGREDVDRLMTNNEDTTAEAQVEQVVLVDIDGDGTVDAVMVTETDGSSVTAIDVDGDGTVDAVITTTEDGQTVVAIDEDGDGTPDILLVDIDGDGTIDAVATLDENGEIVEVGMVEKSDEAPAEG